MDIFESAIEQIAVVRDRLGSADDFAGLCHRVGRGWIRSVVVVADVRARFVCQWSAID